MCFHCSCRPSRISSFFFQSSIWKYQRGIIKNSRKCFWMFIGKMQWKKKIIPGCRSVFPLLGSSLSNFEFFFSIINLEISTGHKNIGFPPDNMDFPRKNSDFHRNFPTRSNFSEVLFLARSNFSGLRMDHILASPPKTLKYGLAKI